MADPDHRPELDSFDQSTVRLYRTGLGLASAAIVLVAVVHLAAVGAPTEDLELVRDWGQLGWVGLVYGTGASVANLHVYDKRIRGALHGSAWFGTVVLLTGLLMSRAELGWWVMHAGVGFLFVTQSGFALKEQFCFRLPLLRLVPAFLAVGVFAAAFEVRLLAGILLLGGGLLQLSMVVAKGRMPLHYDVGDKSKYQV